MVLCSVSILYNYILYSYYFIQLYRKNTSKLCVLGYIYTVGLR